MVRMLQRVVVTSNVLTSCHGRSSQNSFARYWIIIAALPSTDAQAPLATPFVVHCGPALHPSRRLIKALTSVRTAVGSGCVGMFVPTTCDSRASMIWSFFAWVVNAVDPGA